LVAPCLAVLLGTAFITGTHVLSADLDASSDDLVSRTYQSYDAVVQSPVSQEASLGRQLRLPIDPAVAAQIEQVEGVENVAGVVEAPAVQVFGHRGGLPNLRPPTVMLNWVGEPLQQGRIVEGEPPAAEDEIALDEETIDEVGYRLGGDVVLIGPDGREPFRLVGRLAADDPDAGALSPTVVATTSVAQRFAQLGDDVSYLAVQADDTTDSARLVERLGAELPELDVVSGQQFAEQQSGTYSWFADVTAVFVSVFGLIALFVACFIVHNTFSILVAQRTRETALMRALGAERRQVMRVTVLEAVCIGVVASLLGLVVGVVLAAGVRSVVGKFFSSPGAALSVPPTALVLALGVGVVVTVLSAAVPAWRSSTVPPVAAMADVDLPDRDLRPPRAVAGLGILLGGSAVVLLGALGALGAPTVTFGVGAALMVIGLSVLTPFFAGSVARALVAPFSSLGAVTVRIAGDNAARNPRRTSLAAVSLTIGVALVVTIAVVAGSVRASVQEAVSQRVMADYVVRTSSFATGIGIPEAQLAQIADMESVAVVSPLRFGTARVPDQPAPAGSTEPGDPAPDGDDELVVGIDPATFSDVVSIGAVDGSLDQLGADTFAVLRSEAERRGWSIGDEVTLYFPEGPRAVELVATVEEDTVQAGYLLDRATFDEVMLPAFSFDALAFVGTPADLAAADREAVRADLDDMFRSYPNIAVEDLEQYVASRTLPLDTFLRVVYGLLGLAVLIALMGIANTLALSILERRRELGTMRALGMTRGQVRRSVIAESTVIAVFGTLLGLLLGAVLSLALVRILGADSAGGLSWDPPATMLAIVAAAAVLAGVVAAVLPAWAASRTEVLAAIDAV
jgi:putative ABC transport system permease protein